MKVLLTVIRQIGRERGVMVRLMQLSCGTCYLLMIASRAVHDDDHDRSIVESSWRSYSITEIAERS